MDRVKDWEDKEVLTHTDLNAEFSNITDNVESGADVTDVANVAEVIHSATAKATPVDNDELGLVDTAAENVLKKLTWTNAKATLKTYFDTLYTGSGGLFNVVEDTTPQLGGNLDMNGHNIGGNTETQIDDAVTKKHAANADIDLDATFEATFVKKADTVNVLSDITSTGANIEDAVTKKHAATLIGTKTIDETDIADTKVIAYNSTSGNLEYETPGGGGGSGLIWSVISTNTNAATGCGYLINASAGNIILTLPAAPSVSNVVGICDFYNKATTNTITIARNTKNIEGVAEDLIVNVDGAGFTIVYSDNTRGWEIVTEITSGGLSNIVEDTTPQLGGNLDMNGHNIGGNTEAQLDDAVTKKHAANADTALGAQTENLNMNTHKIVGVVDPTTDQEAATKKYVDDNIGGGSGLSWSVISANTNAATGCGYLINASAGNIILTLPAAPSVSNVVGVCDFYNKATTNTITIARNTKNIEGVAEDLIVDLDGAGFTMVYSDATRGWEIVTEISNNSGGGLSNIVEDTTPQLGGNLDMNGHNIGGNTETQIDDAVTKKHAANADTDLDSTFEATFVKKTDTVNVLSDITSAGANIEDAVTKKHAATLIGTKTIDETDIANTKVIAYNSTSGNLEYENAGTPDAHAATHENSGADEISVIGLSGLLADDQHVLNTEVLAVAAAKGANADITSMTGLDDKGIPEAKVISTKTVVVKCIADDTILTTGNGKAYFTIPIELNGTNLVSVGAHVYTTSSSGLPTFQIHNFTDTVDMLSTLLTIDTTEYDTKDATTSAVIDTNTDDIVTGDVLRFDCDIAGTGTKGMEIRMGFRLP